MDLRLWLKVTKRGIVDKRCILLLGCSINVLEINFQCTSVFN